MSTRHLMIAAIATLVISNATVIETAQAFVVAPAGTVQRSAQSLNMTQPIRRVCQMQYVCPRGPTSCHLENVCRVTADYPPENRDRR